LNLMLIPRMGIAGAAWATVIAEAITAAMLFVQVQHRISDPAPLVAGGVRR